MILGSVCWSSVYWVLYIGLPVIAALLVLQSRDEYLAEDAFGIVRLLRWLAAAYAYLWLLTDALPTNEAIGPVSLEIDPNGEPDGASALSRIVTSLPALMVLAVVTVLAGLIWVVGAGAILATGRLPEPVAGFLEIALRYRMRFLAYHLSLVETYPSFDDVRAPSSHRA